MFAHQQYQQRLQDRSHHKKVLQSIGCDITMGEGKRSTEHDDVQSANDGGDVSNVVADCKLEPDIAADEDGQVAVD